MSGGGSGGGRPEGLREKVMERDGEGTVGKVLAYIFFFQVEQRTSCIHTEDKIFHVYTVENPWLLKTLHGASVR